MRLHRAATFICYIQPMVPVSSGGLFDNFFFIIY